MKFNYAPIKNFRKTSGFGPRSTGIKGASTWHNGIDGVPNPPRNSAELILVHDALLLEKFWNDYRGWTCIFDIGEGFTVLYQHKKYSCPLNVGGIYSAGQIVGIMGDSRSKNAIPRMAAHLHFELRKDGKPIDPEPYIKNLEEYEMVREIKVNVDGKVKTVKAILKEGENYIRLRDMEDVLGVVDVEYDAKAGMPIVTD